MEPIIVTRKDGTTTYPLHDGLSYVTEARLVRALLEEDYVEVTLEGSVAGDHRIGDYITVHGRRYTLNQPPEVEKTGSRAFRRKMRFEGVQYDLARVAFLLNVATTNLELQNVLGDTFIGDIEDYMTVLVANANRVFPNSWALGTFPEGTDADTQLTFSPDDNCLSVLQTLCDTFDCEFSISEQNGVNTINLGTVGTTFAHSFRYGAHKGLYELHRRNTDTDNIVNKMWVYGSIKNLPVLYPCDRLMLANTTKSSSYITDSTSISRYGVFEGVRTYDDICPERVGTVTAIDNGDVLKFSDSAMFDLNALWADTTSDYNYYLELTGQSDTQEVSANYQSNVVGTSKHLINGSATIHFNSGGLAGYDFTVSSYDHSTRTFTIKKITDDRGQEFPDENSAAFRIAVGDKYTLADILLPKSYITAAQQRLMAASQADLAELSVPKVRYELKIDGEYIREKCPGEEEALKPGDTVTVADTDFVSSSTQIRARRVEQDLLHPDEYTLTLEDIAIMKRRRNDDTMERMELNGKDAVYERLHTSVSEAGATFIPSVDANGNISWINDHGLPNPTTRNIKGPAGSNGTNGKTFTPSVIGDTLSWSNDGNLPNPQSVKITQKADVLSSTIDSIQEVSVGDVIEEYQSAIPLETGDGWNCNLYAIADDTEIYIGGNLPSGKRLEMLITNTDERDHIVTLTNGNPDEIAMLSTRSQISVSAGKTLLLRARWCTPDGSDGNLVDNTETKPVVYIEILIMEEL